MIKRIHDEDPFMWMPQQEQPNKLFHSHELLKVLLHKVHLRDVVNVPSEYSDLFNLMTTRPDDIYEFTINTPGGSLATTIELIKYIKDLPPDNVKMNLVSANSAGSVIVLQSNNIEVYPHANMMIHDLQIGYGESDLGKTYSMVNYSKESLYEFYNDVYEGFLTKDEIDRVMNGQDFWFGEKEIKRRLKLREKYFLSKQSKKPASKKKDIKKTVTTKKNIDQ